MKHNDARGAPESLQAKANLYGCGHCGYEGPCYGNGFSAPWCKQCERNDKLTPVAGAQASTRGQQP